VSLNGQTEKDSDYQDRRKGQQEDGNPPIRKTWSEQRQGVIGQERRDGHCDNEWGASLAPNALRRWIRWFTRNRSVELVLGVGRSTAPEERATKDHVGVCGCRIQCDSAACRSLGLLWASLGQPRGRECDMPFGQVWVDCDGSVRRNASLPSHPLPDQGGREGDVCRRRIRIENDLTSCRRLSVR
jgi:hypothetical protein